MVTEKHNVVLIEVDTLQQPLTDEQQKFNALSRKITEQKQELALWEQTIQQVQQKVAGELMPQYKQLALYQLQMIELLDDAFKTYKFGKREQLKLHDIICSMCEAVLQSHVDNEQIAHTQQIYSHYQPFDEFEQSLAEDTGYRADADKTTTNKTEPDKTEDHMRQYLREECGIETDGIPLAEVHALYEQMQYASGRQYESSGEHSSQRQQKSKKGKARPTAQQQDLKQTENLAGKSLKSIYQRLAAALHPDREQDEQEKIRKTELMQQATDAYKARDMMALLSLQLKAQQQTGGQVNALMDDQLKLYNMNLGKQSIQLADDILACKAEAASMVNYPHYYLAKPKDILDKVKHALSYNHQIIQAMKRDLRQFGGLESIKHFIHDYRL